MSTFNIFPQPLCSGDTIPLKLTFKNADGTVRDMTGSTLGATVKDMPDNEPDTTAVWTHSVAGDTTGVFQFYIGPLGAGDYWLDCKLWNGTGLRSAVLAPVPFHVLQSVTSRQTP